MDPDKRLVLKYFLAWRLLLFIPLFVASQIIPIREGYEYTHIGGSLLYPWANFDGVHYLSIAGNGYGQGGNFFPLYPLLIKLLSFESAAYGLWPFISALLISNGAFYLALVLFYKLVKEEHSKKVALWSMVFMLVFPTSFFFGSVYAESLFLFLSLAAFWFAKKGKYWLSLVAGILVSSTRLVGVMVAPVLAYKYRKMKFLLIPLGTLAFALFNYAKWGDALNFIKAHGQLANGRSVDGVILIPQTLYRYAKMLIAVPVYNFEWWVVLFELSCFFVALYFLYKAYKKGVDKSYVMFSILAFIVPVSTGTFSGLPRYIIVLFPIYIAMALIKSMRIKMCLACLSYILAFVVLMFFSRGYFIA